MDNSFFIIAATFLGCFLITYAWFSFITRKLSSESFTFPLGRNIFLPLFIMTYSGITFLYFFLPEQHDQLFDLSYLNIAVIFLSTLFIYLISLWPRTAKANWLFFLAAATAGTVFLPSDFLLFEGTIPFWADRLSLVLLWATFAWGYKYLNGIDGLVATQTSLSMAGLAALAFLGALPMLTGSFAGILLAAVAAFAVYNWYPAELSLNSAGCQALGFLTGWLFTIAAVEGDASCCLILSLYYLVEFVWAATLKLSRKPQHQIMENNTFYYQTNLSGLSPASICENIFKVNALLVIFAGFQIYAPNNYSLPALGLILTLWFISHLRNWQEPVRSFKELNQETLRDIKDNLEDFKKNINKDN